MRYVVNNAQMKSAERLCDLGGVSYSEMMNNAGNAVAERILAEYSPRRTAVLCGSGNNGGDGFVIARRLLECGFEARVILVKGAPKTDCASEHFRGLPQSVVWDHFLEAERCVRFLASSEIVVDCVFGTGFHGELPDNIAGLFETANKRPVRISVDIPSGVDSDTGASDPRCFRPTRTFVLAAMKKGLLVPDAMDGLGRFELLDIGIGEDSYKEYEAKITGDSARSIFPNRPASSNKGNFGKLLNIAGSLMYSGAAVMSTSAALRTGAGLTTLAAPRSVCTGLMGRLVENTFLPLPETDDGFIGASAQETIRGYLPQMNAVSIGCGLGNSENTRALTEYVVKNATCPVIIDADGINSLAADINVLKERTGDTVITPHPREFSRISGLSVEEIQRDRIGAARDFAREYGVVVLLKGAYTVVTDGAETFVNPTGGPALAKGGSGDVLTGMLGAMLAQGAAPLEAAVSAAYCHGYAADMLIKENAPQSVLAHDVIEMLTKVFVRVKSGE